MRKFVTSVAAGIRRATRLGWLSILLVCSFFGSGVAVAQTTFGSAKTIVFPVVASTGTFVGQVTLYNPNPSDITVHLNYFDANNTATPGSKPCADAVVPANESIQFGIATQCTLGAGSHFGLLIVTDSTNTNQYYGYSRTQNNAGAGFSIEGFPVANFSTTASSVTGLIRQAAAPTYQTNCFVGSLAAAVTYDLKLFDGTTGVQIGSTISGSLGAFELTRYLDVFAAAGAAAGDYANVRAQFTPTTSVSPAPVLIGFCTVQDNTSFGADFRIAKSVTPVVIVESGAVPWGGPIQQTIGSTGSNYVFVGPTASVNATTSLSAAGAAELARQSGSNIDVSVGVCYQATSGPVTVMGVATTATITQVLTSFSASGAATVPAGTYSVGFCLQNSGGGSVNKNGTTAGFVLAQ